MASHACQARIPLVRLNFRCVPHAILSDAVLSRGSIQELQRSINLQPVLKHQLDPFHERLSKYEKAFSLSN